VDRYKEIFERNIQWAAEIKTGDASFFEKLALGQDPDFLYIGCSDSRVTAEQMMGAGPGEVFVHRNVANLVHESDQNTMSAIWFAVAVLKVKHIVVCGHYDCGGIRAAEGGQSLAPMNDWIEYIRNVFRKYRDQLESIPDEKQKHRKMVELNVEEQCKILVRTRTFREALLKNPDVLVHGWVFDVETGLLRDLGLEKVLDQQHRRP
jgi:carbonic anhydrase